MNSQVEPVILSTQMGNDSWLASCKAYFELCKPRVVSLMLITAVVGMYLATSGAVPWKILIFGTLGIGLAAGSAAVVNHLVDQRIDAIMARTRSRPIPTNRVKPMRAALFAFVLAVSAMVILVYFVNVLTAVLSFLTMLGYAGFYSLYLKRRTPQNIVIGGITGATPPLLGWTAVTGDIALQSLLLVLIIFVWTPPHFWALAIHRFEDYKKAQIPMLPVTHGIEYTKTSVLVYTLLLIFVTLLPYWFGLAGLYYLIPALALGAGFLYRALMLKYGQDKRAAIKTFHYSIAYLLFIFVFLLIGHYL